ncbi:MAG: hypothetical protein QM703_26090 [Gemmatales bacterium]
MSEEALLELLGKTPEAERAALLDRACEGNPDLRARVEDRLKAASATEATTGFQATASFASRYGAALHNLAAKDMAEKNLEPARKKLVQAIEWQQKVRAANPKNPEYRQFLINHLTNLAITCRALGDTAGQEEAEQQLSQVKANAQPTAGEKEKAVEKK